MTAAARVAAAAREVGERMPRRWRASQTYVEEKRTLINAPTRRTSADNTAHAPGELHKPGADQSKSLGIPAAGLLDAFATLGSRNSNLAEIVCLAKSKAAWKELPLTRSS